MAQELRDFLQMARISVARNALTYRVTLQGYFSAADLNRLERACRYALEHKLVPLELNLERVTRIDAAARFYIELLRARGARILKAPAFRDLGDLGDIDGFG
jgi:hypothetical protein